MLLSEQYYEKGFFLTKLDKLNTILLWDEILKTNWILDTVDNIYKQIPDWYISNIDIEEINGDNRSSCERIIGEHIVKNAPESLKKIAKNLTNTPTFDFIKTYYKSCELKFLDMWNGSEEIPYHFDTINGCDMLVIIYLTEQTTWNKDWGGTITMKKQVGDSVLFEEEYFPNNGSMLVINNSNPLVYHKVKALNNNIVNRYTFSFNYNWS